MTDTRRWLESRHLRLSEAGQRALAQLERMEPSSREALLVRGDEFANTSVALAHAWLVAAAEARTALTPGDVGRWERGVVELMGSGGAGRAAAVAYLTLSPLAIGSLSQDTLETWIRVVGELQGRTQRLAASFVEITGRVLTAQGNAVGADVLRAWGDAVAHALSASRWRGEFLAGRLIETGEALIPVLSPAAVTSWAHVLSAIGQSGRTPRCPEIPQAVLSLEPTLCARVLAATAAAAAADAAAGERMLEALPRAVLSLSPLPAASLLDALDVAGPRSGLAEAVALLAATLHETPATTVAAVLAHASDIARAFPRGLPAYLRTADRAHEQGGPKGIALWVARGIELGARNEKAGIAHFQLETRTAHKLLVQHSTAIAFEEIQPVMQRYSLMIARLPLHLACGSGIWLRPPLSAPEERSVRLPERVDLFETSEENQLFYKVAVAHAAGRWQFGTYDVRIERLAGHGIAYETDRTEGDVIAFIDSFPNPLLAAGLFVVLEGARVDAALAREFKGLGADLDRLGGLYASLPLPTADRAVDTLVEALFLLSVGRVPANRLPSRLRNVSSTAERAVARLQRPAATAYDSADLLIRLYRLLAFASAIAARDEDVAALIEIGGATIIDPLDYSEGGFSAGSSQLGTQSDGPSVEIDTEGPVTSKQLRLQLDHDAPTTIGGIPLTPEQLKQLIEDGVDLEIVEGHGEDQAALGLYITDLLGKLPAERIEHLRRMIEAGDIASVRAWLAAERGRDFHYYDEWDYQIRDYRRRWCRLAEIEIEGDGGRYVGSVLARWTDLIARVRREFLLMRPEQFRKVRGMEDGEDFDINALVEAHADRRTRRSTSERLYIARRREERDVATLFLIDMSASTDEPVVKGDGAKPERRVIEVTKDALIVMAAVLHELGDAYAVYGFSGHGRENVECYPVKTFAERWGPTVRARIGGVEPKRSTRMGAALRHAGRKLSAVSARARHLLLLSDGFPQDYDYGEDRRSNVYGIRDTTVALQELETQGIKTFCITVDPAGHDYLRDMCPTSRYAVLEDVETLPEEMPRIYRAVTR